jgi:hypothetical protein
MEELKENIHREIDNIPAEQLLLVRGMSVCRGTVFSGLPATCEQR